MPYIKAKDRQKLETGRLEDLIPSNKGELNYCITRLMHSYVLGQGKSYEVLSNAKGAAQDAAEEFSRLVLAPYEDTKRQENGPVSVLDEVSDE